jgi:hypothetical protein
VAALAKKEKIMEIGFLGLLLIIVIVVLLVK